MAETVKRRFFTWTLFRRLFIFFAILAVIGVIALVAVVAALSRDLPTIASLETYEPPITSRVHAGNGTLVAEFADEHRVYVPYESIPEHVIQAFVSAEDKKFFEHGGIDFTGMLRGAINSARNKITGEGGLQGGSTITQQVVKNMLLTRDQTIVRKIKEAVLARRIEGAFTKQQIMELYLNEIYLGGRAYGVGSAALNYFGKSLPELSVSEAAILASLAKAPGTVNPYRRPERLLSRRSYVLARMVEDGYITEETARAARATPLNTVKRLRGAEYEAATYFVQELRRDLIDEYGEDTLEQGGLSIRSTIDSRLQLAAQTALQTGLVSYDRRHAYRGPVASIALDGDALERLRETDLPAGHGDWEAGLVTSISEDGSAALRLRDNSEIPLVKEDVEWAANTYERADGTLGLEPGDIVLAQFERDPAPEATPQSQDDESDPGTEAGEDGAEPLGPPVGTAALRQVPQVEGALIALDPHTGRVLAMSGGYSFWKSAFNRVTQARRQPGSSFKPFVYAAALENGYTPATKVLDAPFVEFDVEKNDFWSPGNYAEGRFYGLSTIRLGLEKSRNLMTVRMAQDIGMPAVSDLATRLGIYEELDPFLAMSLGAGETSPWNLAKGYATLVNGGKRVAPTLLDRIQDRHGNTLYVHDPRECTGCNADQWDGGPPPQLADPRPQVLDPIVAYQVVHMLEGVVERGTGRVARRVGKPLAGKTGTTNDYKDALFFGFSPDLVVGVWVGFDGPKTLGDGEAGGSVAAPIFTDFMEAALKDEPALPFRIPPGVRLVRIDARTGELPGPGTDVVITEAFRPGTEPGLAFAEDEEMSIFGQGNTGLFEDRRAGNRTAHNDEPDLMPGLPGLPESPDSTDSEEMLPGLPGQGDPDAEGGRDARMAGELGDTW